MLRYYAKHSRGENFTEDIHPRKGGWVLGEHVSRDEIAELSKRFGLDANAMADVKDPNELSHVDHGSDQSGLYIFLRTVDTVEAGVVATAPLVAVLKKELFLSIAQKSAKHLKQIITEKTDKIEDLRPMSLFLVTFAAVIEEYETQLNRTNKTIHRTRELLRSRKAKNDDFMQFVTIEDNLNEYQMNLQAMRSVAERLVSSQNKFHFQQADIESMEDISLYIQQLLTAIQSHTQSVNSIRNAYSTIADTNLNERMRRLTILTVLIALPNLFYGMYGMNIMLPFQDQPWAYPAMIGLTIFIVIFAYLVAKSQKLL